MNKILNRKYIFLMLIISSFSNLGAQCTEENTQTNATNSNSLGIGQTFNACDDGLIEEISFQTGGSFTPTSITMHLRDSNCTTIWTVSNVPTSPNQTITIDLSTGSGSSRTAVLGSTYTFNIIYPSGGSGATKQVKYSSSNPYSDGFMTRTNCTNWPAANDDMWFQVEIGTTLPVTLVDFRGRIIDNKIKLDWMTEQEINNQGFEIQHSVNGKEWIAVGYLNGQRYSTTGMNYEFTFANTILPLNYFRLKQIDFDGKYMFSETISIKDISLESVNYLYPNPSNGSVNLRLTNVKTNTSVKIIDINGIIHFDKADIQKSRIWSKDLHLSKKGLYFVLIQNGNSIKTERLLIQ